MKKIILGLVAASIAATPAMAAAAPQQYRGYDAPRQQVVHRDDQRGYGYRNDRGYQNHNWQNRNWQRGQRFDSFWPSASSTSWKTSRACGLAAASALPMPTAWLPCPGKMNARICLSLVKARGLVPLRNAGKPVRSQPERTRRPRDKSRPFCPIAGTGLRQAPPR